MTVYLIPEHRLADEGAVLHDLRVPLPDHLHLLEPLAHPG